MGYYYCTTFAAAVMTVIIVLVGGGHLRTAFGGPICGETPATEPATFAGYLQSVLDILVKDTAIWKPTPGQGITYTVTIPVEGGPGSATGTSICYDRGHKTAKDCRKCLADMQPFLENCVTTSSSSGEASYEGKCTVRFWENV